MNVVAHDLVENPLVTALGIPYGAADDIIADADVVSLHLPLLPSTRHFINRERCALSCFCARLCMLFRATRHTQRPLPAHTRTQKPTRRTKNTLSLSLSTATHTTPHTPTTNNHKKTASSASSPAASSSTSRAAA